MTKQLGKSSKSLRCVCTLYFLQHRLLSTRSLHLCPQGQSACQKQGQRAAASYQQFCIEQVNSLPKARGTSTGSKKQEKGRRKKAGGRNANFLSLFLHLLIPDSTGRFQHLGHLLRTDRGFLTREERSVPIAKSKGTTAKKLYWGIGCGVFVYTIICQLQSVNCRQTANN